MGVLNILKNKNKTDASIITAVFTRKKIMVENELITKVYNSMDNAFDFVDKYASNSNENIPLVSIKQILEKDASVSLTIHISTGYWHTGKRLTTNGLLSPMI